MSSAFPFDSPIDISIDDIKEMIKHDPEEDWTSCWNCALTIEKKLYPDGCEDDFEEVGNLQDIWDKDGIYEFIADFADGSFHHFAVDTRGTKMLMVATFGGYQELIKKSYDKNDWIMKVCKALAGYLGQKNKLEEIFGVPEHLMKSNKFTLAYRYYPDSDLYLKTDGKSDYDEEKLPETYESAMNELVRILKEKYDDLITDDWVIHSMEKHESKRSEDDRLDLNDCIDIIYDMLQFPKCIDKYEIPYINMKDDIVGVPSTYIVKLMNMVWSWDD